MATTKVTLYRLGNASSPRMENVRPRDIEVVERDGEMWVLAGTGGISTNELPGPLKGVWWRLNSGYDYGGLIIVRNDHGAHWAWEPAQDMRLEEFKDALRATNTHFARL